MAEDSSVQGVLRYLKGRTPEQPVPTNYDIVSFARSVMVSDAQKLFVSAAFPPELRLQAMKAGVPRNTVCNLSAFGSMKTIADLRNEAYDLLLSPAREHWYQADPWDDEETSKVIRSIAEQAFLETAIFKLVIDKTLPTLKDDDWMSGISYLSEAIGSRIHYLHINTTTQGHWSPYDSHGPVNVTWCRNLTSGIEMLKLHFANLKACILTLDICFGRSVTARGHRPFNRRVLQWTTRTDTDYKLFGTTFAAEVITLLDAFVAQGPGKSQFVRIRYYSSWSHHEYSEDPIYYGLLIKVEREKMAAESEKGSFGAQLFEEAYRLGRIFERSWTSATEVRW